MPVWIRPLAAHGNTQDGTSYATAYLGLKHASIPWTDGTQDLNICGVHLPPTFTSGDPYVLYGVSSVAGAASSLRKRIIRGDAYPSDPAVIHCGMFQENGSWTDEGGGVWSKALWDSFGRAWGGGGGNGAPATNVFEYDGVDYTWLQYARSLSECQSTAGSTFVAGTGTRRLFVADSSSFTVSETVTGGTSGATSVISAKGSGYLDLTTWNNVSFTAGETVTSAGGSSTVSAAQQYIQGNGLVGDTWYVHTSDGLTPANRVCRPGWGWNPFAPVAWKNIILHGIKFVGAQGWTGGKGTPPTPYHDGFEIRRCVFDGFNGSSILVLNKLHRDVLIDRCEIAWGENGPYHFLLGTDGADLYEKLAGRLENFRFTRNYVHDLGRKERTTITSDNHGVAAQGCDGVLVSGNIFERCGNMVVFWAGADTYAEAAMKNITLSRNVSADPHDEGNFQFRLCYEITDQTEAGQGTYLDATGNKIEYCIGRCSTSFVGMNAVHASSGIVANIPEVSYCYFEGGKRTISQSSARYWNFHNNICKGPVDYFNYHAVGFTANSAFDYNTYLGSPTNDFYSAGVKTGAEWQALGFDVHGTGDPFA